MSQNWSIEEYRAWLKSKEQKRSGKSKYNVDSTKAIRAITCRCLNEHVHDSRDEASYCNLLFFRKRAGDILDYEIQKTFYLPRTGKPKNHIKADFWVTNNDGSKEIQEFKGVRTSAWRIKANWFISEYPEIRYVVKDKADILGSCKAPTWKKKKNNTRRYPGS